MDRFDDKGIADKCMVKGCDNDRDFGSTQHLCRFCYDLITTGDMLKYYGRYSGKNWMSDTVMKIVHLQQDKQDLQDVVDELNKDIKEAYILENGDVLSLNDLRTFYHENKNLKSQNLPLIHENQALTKENKALKERVELLEKERSALIYNMNHAYNLGDGKFLTIDDLHNFYEENSKPKDDGRFQSYTEGFWKGFDMGYSKARDQFYE